MSEQARIENAIDTTIDNCEVLRARLAKYEDADGKPITTIAEQAREIERLQLTCNDLDDQNERIYAELAALKAQPSGVVLADDIRAACQNAVEVFAEETNAAQCREVAEYMREVLLARLNSSPVSAGEPDCDRSACGDFSPGPCDNPDCPARRDRMPASAGDERAAFDTWFARDVWNEGCYGNPDILRRQLWPCWQARAALSANHSEQVREGWQLVPVEPTDAMLEAGDKYIGTPATYKSMLSACPSPAITKDFSQFLSAVMDAAGLIRHGRQSKELSEYLGMKCMEYRSAAPSAGSQGGDA